MKYIVPALKIILNIFIFLLASAVILLIAWNWFGQNYLFASSPVGSDYFNALTYAKFFRDHLTLPPKGWLPFWNAGAPVVGGYPWLAFYLLQPLTQFTDLATSMEAFAATSLMLFFIASLILFGQVSKNWLVAFALTLILAATRATYYPLLTGGFITASSIQWYLPTVVFFIYKFGQTNKDKFLVLASIFAGIALLQQAPTSLLMIVLPSLFVLLFLTPAGEKARIKFTNIGIFLLIATSIGSMGLYTVFLQTILGSGTGACQSPECWGVYPKHLTIWMTALAPMLVGVFLLLSLTIKLFKKTISLNAVLPPLAGLSVLVFYALAAYLKLIDGLANVLFPTRTFWAANLFLLLVAASLFSTIKRGLGAFSHLIAAISLLAISSLVATNPVDIHRDFTATVPLDVARYVIPKYQTNSPSELIPPWIRLEETNWRLDTFNPGLTHWWNFIAQMPSTYGYSNHPIGKHRDWQYFLQTATREPEEENPELVKNQALYLLDAYGVGFHENSIASYPSSIIADPEIIINSAQLRDFSWYQLSPSVTSPVVFPTGGVPVLFVGNDAGYESFIRAISMTNLNSQILIPIKGPQSINKIKDKDLENFKTLVLYHFEGKNWDKIERYVERGGNVIIEGVGFGEKLLRLPKIYPVETISVKGLTGKWIPKILTKSEFTQEIELNKFANFDFNGDPWKIYLAEGKNIKPWAKPVLAHEDNVVIVEGQLGEGRVVWSGINLPFHIVNNNNLEEAKLFKNLISSLTTLDRLKPEFEVQRPIPEKIIVNGKNFNGIYFKENFDSGWKAKVNGKNLPVYSAGLDFMYIPVPAGKEGVLSVSIFYVGSLVSWALFYLTLASLGLAVLFIFIPKPFILLKEKAAAYTAYKQKEIVKELKGWWRRD